MKKMNIAIAACSAMLLVSGAHANKYTHENSMKINSCAQGVNLEVTAELPCYKDPSARYPQNCKSSASGKQDNVCVVGVDINLNNSDKIYDVTVSPSGQTLQDMFGKKYWNIVGTAKNKFNLSVYPKGQATYCPNNMYSDDKENTYVLCWGTQ